MCVCVCVHACVCYLNIEKFSKFKRVHVEKIKIKRAIKIAYKYVLS